MENTSQSPSTGLIPVTVKLVNGEGLSVEVDPSITVDEWRQQLEPLVQIPPHQQRLVASGRVLQVWKLQGSACRVHAFHLLSFSSLREKVKSIDRSV